MMKLTEINDRAKLHEIVREELKANFNIKVPKLKKQNSTKNEGSPLAEGSIFGKDLEKLPMVYTEDCGLVPKVLVDAFTALEERGHLTEEGLFRRPGNMARIKILKGQAEKGEKLEAAVTAHDLSSMLKQFLREMPEPLLPFHLYPSFVKCHELKQDCMKPRAFAVLQLILLLPEENIRTLRYVLTFLHKVAANEKDNKMNVENLAVCVTPNILKADKACIKGQEKKQMKAATDIVVDLIQNSHMIGHVGEGLLARLQQQEEPLVAEEEHAAALDTSRRSQKKKKRSGSFQDMMSSFSNSFSKGSSKRRRGTSKERPKDATDSLSFIMIPPTNPSDQSVLSAEDNGSQGIPLSEPSTPKMMRPTKRKHDDIQTPAFSANRRNQILGGKSTLGNTPFMTPGGKRAKASEDHVTASTPLPDQGPSPVSSSKVKRNTSGNTKCFSPKTPKSTGLRRLKKFVRRLSGGKNGSPNSLNVSDIGHHGRERRTGESDMFDDVDGGRCDCPNAACTCDPADDHAVYSRKSRRKTPSSPARLVGNLMNHLNQHDHPDDDDEEVLGGLRSSVTSLMSGTSSNPSLSSLERLSNGAKRSSGKVHSPATSSEISEADTEKNAAASETANRSQLNRSGLRRGKPNTVQTGLPSPNKRRSMEVSMKVNNGSSREHLDDVCFTPGLSAVDTSPIQRSGNMMNPRMLVDDEESIIVPCMQKCESGRSLQSVVDSPPLYRNSKPSSSHDESASLSRQSSTSSVTLTVESDHDRAFIQESMLNEDESEPAKGESEFKVPVGIPKTSSSRLQIGQSKSDSTLSESKSKSVESIDSGIGCEDRKQLTKSMSLQTVNTEDTAQPEEVTAQNAKLLTTSLHHQPYTGGRAANLLVSPSTHSILSRIQQENDDDKEDEAERLERLKSPYRFNQSASRRRGISPIRIPAIFQEADTANRERQQPHEQRCARGNSPVRRRAPNLPINTAMPMADAVQLARNRCNDSFNSEHHQQTTTVTNTENSDLPAISTPKIKLPMMNTGLANLVNKRPLTPMQVTGADKAPIRLTARSAVKPVKRLQGGASPRSPHRFSRSRSPRRPNNNDHRRLSPLPNQSGAADDDWNV